MEKELLNKILLRGSNVFIVSNRSNKKIEIINMKLGEIYSQEGYYKYLILLKYFAIKNEIKMVEDIFFKREILREFIKCDDVNYQQDFKEFVLINNSELISLNEQDLIEIFDILIQMYQIHIEEEDIEGAEDVVELLKELVEFQKECEKKNGITMDSMIEAITVKHNSYNLLNIWDLTIYQLYQTYKRIILVDSYNEINHWKYPGFIDISKIDQNEIYWAKNI